MVFDSVYPTGRNLGGKTWALSGYRNAHKYIVFAWRGYNEKFTSKVIGNNKTRLSTDFKTSSG